MRGRLFLIALSLFLLCGLGAQIGATQSPDYVYSDKNGHTISGAFLDYYRRSPNPKIIHGEPITEAFIDAKTNILVQYFEKSLFEFHPAAPVGQQIYLSPLGMTHYLLVKDQIQPVDVFENSQGCRIFQDTKLKVCLAFLAFYEANGGEHTFGPPVSNAVWVNGRLVQYFFFSKLEWHPELPAGKSIQVTNLGYENFHLNREDPSRLKPILPKNNTISSVTSLNTRAAVSHAVTSTKGQQSVHILVTDQRQLPVAGAQAMIIVRLPSGDENRYIIPETTDQNGITKFSFPFNSVQVGMTDIQVIVTHNHLKSKTATSFRIWW